MTFPERSGKDTELKARRETIALDFYEATLESLRMNSLASIHVAYLDASFTRLTRFIEMRNCESRFAVQKGDNFGDMQNPELGLVGRSCRRPFFDGL